MKQDEPDPIEVPITGEIDLHAFAPQDVPSVVEEYLTMCRARGILAVRVIHGRGKGVQRAVVHRLLSRLPGIESFRDATPESGGWGATVVSLAPPSSGEPR